MRGQSKDSKDNESVKTEMKKYNENLLRRTLTFSENLIDLLKKLPKNLINLEISKQVFRSGASVGANYREACEAESSRDFVHKIKVVKKEARETKYWLKLLLKNNPELSEDIIKLGKECAELIKIFSSIVSKFKPKAD